jgi:hypothetical protein
MRRWGGCVNLRVETHHSCELITAMTELLRKCGGLAPAWGWSYQNANLSAGNGAFVRVKNADSVYAVLHLFH